MARKKQKENIVIQPTELVPTTIGTINTKESGPIFVIILIALFLIGIFFLDKVNDFLNNRTPETPNAPVVEKPIEKDPEEPSTENESEIHLLTEESFLVEGFEVSNMSLIDQTLSLKITRKEGNKDLFLNQNYYLELYNAEKTFLGRLKIENISIINSRNFTFDVTSIQKNGTVGALSIVLKTENDYPYIEVNETNSNEYTLVCSKEEESISYIFSKENDKYSLNEIEKEITVSQNENDYDTQLEEYTTLVDSLEEIEGLRATLTPLSVGFRYSINVKLNTISESDYNKYLKENTYYKAKTEAKVIAFELETSGYTCE